MTARAHLESRANVEAISTRHIANALAYSANPTPETLATAQASAKELRAAEEAHHAFIGHRPAPIFRGSHVRASRR